MFKKLLLISTSIICVTTYGSILGIAKTEKNLAVAQSDAGTERRHKTAEIPAGQPTPSVDLIVHKDSMKGYNLEAKVSNFRFAPEDVNTAAKPGEGHAHLNVNDKKIARLYGSWYYLEKLQPGKNKISVSLNANTHENLTHNGEMIQDTEIVTVPASSK